MYAFSSVAATCAALPAGIEAAGANGCGRGVDFTTGSEGAGAVADGALAGSLLAGGSGGGGGGVSSLFVQAERTTARLAETANSFKIALISRINFLRLVSGG
jgi:hypothetical protein